MSTLIRVLFGRNPRLSCGILLAFVLCAGIVLIVGAIGVYQDQQNAIKQYGETAIKLCSTISSKTIENTDLFEAASTKVTIIDTSMQTIADSYVKVLATDRVAKDQSDLTGIICLDQGQKEYGEADTYSTDSGTTKYTCQRYVRTTDVYLFDVKSGTLAKRQQFVGATPDECPDTTKKSLSVYGGYPAEVAIAKWVAGQTAN
jgi:hypothetical protein